MFWRLIHTEQICSERRCPLRIDHKILSFVCVITLLKRVAAFSSVVSRTTMRSSPFERSSQPARGANLIFQAGIFAHNVVNEEFINQQDWHIKTQESKLISDVVRCTRISEIDDILFDIRSRYQVSNSTIALRDLPMSAWLSLNVASAALCRVVHISGQLKDPRSKRILNITDSHSIPQAIRQQREMANLLLPQLFHTINENIYSTSTSFETSNASIELLSTSASLYLHSALARLLKRNTFYNSAEIFAVPCAMDIARENSTTVIMLNDIFMLSDKVLAASIINRSEAFIRQAGTSRLISFVWSITTLRTNSFYEAYRKEQVANRCIQTSIYLDEGVKTLLRRIGARLSCSDAIGAASAKDLCVSLWCFAKLNQTDHDCISAYLRRLRKGVIRDKLDPVDIFKVVWAASRAVNSMKSAHELRDLASLQPQSSNHISIVHSDDFSSTRGEKLLKDAQLTCHALVRRLRFLLESQETSNALSSKLSNYLTASGILSILKQIDILNIELEQDFRSFFIGLARAKCAVEYPLLPGAKTRHLTEALWACGKMAAYEDPLRDQIEFGEQNPPPYLDAALSYTVELSTRTSSMSTKDTAQVIWAMARLDISRSDVIQKFAEKATEEACNFNAIEVANILWGFSKLSYYDAKLTEALIQRILDPSVQSVISSQEAANVLYALAKLNLYHEEAFAVMCTALKKNLNDATPQAIANALWAHETVGEVAPTDLFDSWAQKKLGIVGPGSFPTREDAWQSQ